MRRHAGAVLAFIGGFVLVLAATAQFYLHPRLVATPLDAVVTRTMEGVMTDAGRTVPVRVTSVSRVVPGRSGDDVVSWENSTCMVTTVDPTTPDCLSGEDSDRRLLLAIVDDFATDRRTGEAVNDPEYLPPHAVAHEGQVEEWPPAAEERAYRYWHRLLGRALVVTYERTEDVAGVACHVYVAEPENAQVRSPSGDVEGWLTGRVELWVEPVTGTVVKQREEYTRRTATGSVIRVEVESEAEQVERLADGARDDRDRVQLLTGTLPTAGYAVGAVLLAAAVVVAVTSRRRPRQRRGSPVADHE